MRTQFVRQEEKALTGGGSRVPAVGYTLPDLE